MHIHLHIKFWIILFLVCLFGLPVIITPVYQLKRINVEVASAERIFGTEKTLEIVEGSKGVYKGLFVDSGIVQWASDHLAVQQDQQRTARKIFGGFSKISDGTNNWIFSSIYAIYGLFIRLGIMWQWFLYMIPLFFGATIEGWVTRRIKFNSFGFTPPIAFSAGVHTLIALLGFPFLYLIVPMPVTPYFMPCWAIIFAISLVTVFANMQRLKVETAF